MDIFWSSLRNLKKVTMSGLEGLIGEMPLERHQLQNTLHFPSYIAPVEGRTDLAETAASLAEKPFFLRILVIASRCVNLVLGGFCEELLTEAGI